MHTGELSNVGARAGDRGFWIQKLLGLSMVLLALGYLFDPEWPLAGAEALRSEVDASAASATPLARIEAVGLVWRDADALHLRPPARVGGRPWQVVLFDRAGAERLWTAPQRGPQDLPAAAQSLVDKGEVSHWRIHVSGPGRPLLSPVAPLPPR